MTTIDILDKVRKLLRLSASNNSPEEAAAAAAKAQSLIDEHQLSAALLSIDSHTESTADSEPIIDFETKGAPLDPTARSPRWRSYLATTIAKYNACRIYTNGAIQIIGRPSDVSTVRYLFGYLLAEINRLSNEHGAGCGRVWNNNFRLGCVETIARRMRDQHNAWIREQRTLASFNAPDGQTSQALMRIDTALQIVEQRATRVDDWTKENVKLRTRSASPIRYNSNAREAGRRAGASISLSARGGSLTSGAKALKGGS